MALGDICVPLAWQVWHLLTSTLILRGRRGTYGTGLALVGHLVLVDRPGRSTVTFQWFRNFKNSRSEKEFVQVCALVGAQESLKEGTPREVGNSLVHAGTAAITTPRGVPMLASEPS